MMPELDENNMLQTDATILTGLLILLTLFFRGLRFEPPGMRTQIIQRSYIDG
jgi:hypothetical protein